MDSVHRIVPNVGADPLAAMVAGEGTAATAFASDLASTRVSNRDLADAVHLLCLLHGRHPGVLDHAAKRAPTPEWATWVEEARDRFADERAYLAHLTAAAGPLPSTPGQAETEATVVAQRHALDMLAQSSRAGCALGAALAFVLDWRSIRSVLDTAARRFAVAAPACTLSAATLAIPATAERALGFGAQQLVAQHRGLWQLLEARAEARGAH